MIKAVDDKDGARATEFRDHSPVRLAVGALLAFSVAAVLGWAWLALPQVGTFAHLQVTLSGDPDVRHQLYYASSPTFAESRSGFAPATRSGEAKQALRLPPSGLRFVRVDPGSAAPVRLCRLNIDAGVDRLATLETFTIVRTKQVASWEKRESCIEIVPEPGATDPYIVLEAPTAVPDWEAPPSGRGLPGVVAALAIGLAAVLVLLATRGMSFPALVDRVASAVDLKLPLIYVVLALSLGTGYLLITPPGAVPDELAHATKVVKVANGELMGSTGGMQFPNVYHMYGEFNGFRSSATRFIPAQLYSRANSQVLCEGTTSNLPSGADSYGPHLYVAPAMAYTWACASESSFGAFLWLSRAGNLLIAVLLTGLGMWFSSRARWALFVIALMPMTVYQMASLSADAMYFGLCFAWFGLTCGIAEARISARRAAPALVSLAILITFSKPGGAWVLASILFLRGAFVRDYSRFWPAVVAYLAVPAIAHAAWVLGAGTEAVPLDGVDPAFNLSQANENPLHVAGLFFTAYTGVHGWGLLRSMMGQLGWLDILLPAWVYTTILASLAGALLLGRGASQPSLSSRGLAVCFALGSLVMLSIPLYLFWTPPDAIRIGGLQGRYFIPSLAFAWTWLAVSGARGLQSILMLLLPVAMTLPLLHGLLAVAMRYYPL